MMLVDAPGPEVRISPVTFIPAVLVVAVGTILLVRIVIRAQKMQATTGSEGLLGRTAVAETNLDPRAG